MLNSIKTDIAHLDKELELLEADWQAAEHRLLQFYVRVMPKVMDVERCSIFVVDRDSEDFWLRAGTGLRERSIEIDKLTQSIVGEAVEKKDVIYRDNLDEESDDRRGTVDTIVGSTTKDILCMPIWSLDGKRITGAVQLVNRIDGKPYTEEDTAMLEELCHYLELAIENIYFQQEASGVVGRIYRTLRRTIIGAAIGFFVVIAVLALYWTVFFLIGE